MLQSRVLGSKLTLIYLILLGSQGPIVRKPIVANRDEKLTKAFFFSVILTYSCQEST